MKPFFIKNFWDWAWIWAIGVFSANLSAPILVIYMWVPCPCFPLINHSLYKKLSLYIQIRNIHLGLRFEFGPQRIRDLAIVCPYSVIQTNEWENKLTVLYKACTIYNLNISSQLTKMTVIDFFFSKYVLYLLICDMSTCICIQCLWSQTQYANTVYRIFRWLIMSIFTKVEHTRMFWTWFRMHISVWERHFWCGSKSFGHSVLTQIRMF